MTDNNSGGFEGAAAPKVDLVLAEKYQDWKKTTEFEDLFKESKEMRPDVEPYLIEQVLFGYFMTDILKIPLKESKMKKPKPEELVLQNCEVFDSEEEYKKKYPHVKELQPINVPEGKPIFELLETTQPIIVDGTNVEDD